MIDWTAVVIDDYDFPPTRESMRRHVVAGFGCCKASSRGCSCKNQKIAGSSNISKDKRRK